MKKKIVTPEMSTLQCYTFTIDRIIGNSILDCIGMEDLDVICFQSVVRFGHACNIPAPWTGGI